MDWKGNLLNRCSVSCLLAVICLTSAPRTLAQSKFAGVLLSGRGEGFVAGNIRLTVRRGEVMFQSTLFRGVATNWGLEAVLVSQNKVLPIAYTNGITGSFPIGEFLGPIPGWDTTRPCGWEFTGIDPGFNLPVYFDGVRFAGSLTAFPGLENLMRARSGTLYLQMRGSYAGLQDPLFTALLVEERPPRAEQFVAEVSEPGATTAGATPLRLDASFSLSDNCLNYTLIWDASASWTFAGIVGRTGPHTGKTDLVADISTPQRIHLAANPNGPRQIIYFGAVPLTDKAVKQLKLGKLSLHVTTTQSSEGELRGQISPLTKEDRKLHPK